MHLPSAGGGVAGVMSSRQCLPSRFDLAHWELYASPDDGQSDLNGGNTHDSSTSQEGVETDEDA